jgi:hypothetical protein
VRWLDRIPWSVLLLAAILLGTAPLRPEPHLWQKLKLLASGTLVRPIDVFDLAMHGAPIALLALKLGRAATLRRGGARSSK